MAAPAHVMTLKKVEVAFAMLTGEGRKGKKAENEYVLGVVVSKKQKKQIIDEISEFFNSNKTARAKEPAYDFEDWFTENKEDPGTFIFWASEVVSNDITRKVAPGTGYGMKEFSSMGSGSVVDAEYRFFYFNNSYGEGIGLRLSAVLLREYVEYSGGGGSTLEGETLQMDGTQVAGSSSEDDDIVEDFEEALEDGDLDEAKALLKQLKDHPDYKKFKKAYKAAK